MFRDEELTIPAEARSGQTVSERPLVGKVKTVQNVRQWFLLNFCQMTTEIVWSVCPVLFGTCSPHHLILSAVRLEKCENLCTIVL